MTAAEEQEVLSDAVGMWVGKDREPAKHAGIVNSVQAAGFHLTTSATVQSVATSDDLAELYADVGTMQVHPHLSVIDADGRPWIIWDTEDGDFLASSLPMEDDDEDPNSWSRVQVDGLVFPVTVLHPHPTPPTDPIVAARNRFKEHSILLNQIGWRIAEALGEVTTGDASIEADIPTMLERLIERAPMGGAS